MKELLLRAASGAVYVAMVLGAAWLGAWTTYLLFLAILVLAALEWYRLFWPSGQPRATRFETVSLAVFTYGLGSYAVGLVPASALTHWLGALLCVAVVAGASRERDKAKAALFSLSIPIYLALPLLCAPALVRRDPMLFIGFMLLLWTNDTGAYLVGKSIGRNKLMPQVSPGKTWEGLLGGIALTALVAWLLSQHITALSLTAWIAAAVVVSITATAGDLFESYMKRRAGVKDSGRIMPGHGGALDRFDGYLLAAPAMLLVVLLLR